MRSFLSSQIFCGGVAVTICAAASLFVSPALARYPETSLDYGPFTPEANSAYMGGGVIIERPAQPAPQYSAQPHYPGYYTPPVAYERPDYPPTAVYPYGVPSFCRWPGYC